jgi:hypothetical protein
MCCDRTYKTSSPALSLPLLPPSTPSLSKVSNSAFNAASSPSNLSPSTSTSYALFATLNFSASSAKISLACLPASCLFSSYSCCECRLLSRRERDLSAFCCAARRELRFEPSAEREEEMRARLSLSGAMWNWFVVSEMSWEGVSEVCSWRFVLVCCFADVLLRGLRRRGPSLFCWRCDRGWFRFEERLRVSS